MSHVYHWIGILCVIMIVGCNPTKKISKAIAAKDSVVLATIDHSYEDSIREVGAVLDSFHKNRILFNTFSAKVKVDVEDHKGKQPDILANIRIVKDSLIWVSLTASMLNIEVYRLLITRDSVILLNKQEKTVQYRSLDFLQDVAHIPVDFFTIQNLLVGNPVFLPDSISSYKKQGEQILLTAIGPVFKNLLTLQTADKLLMHIKLDDVDMNRHRTADITYADYEMSNRYNFSTYRQVIATEKNKIEIKLKFKQYEFNKELSTHFPIPRNYKAN